MKVAIVGSREFPHPGLVREFVMSLPLDTVIISGGARGVDSIAEEAARKRGLRIIIFPALWDQYGRSAGLLRNQHIVDAADEVVAFHDGVSRGTMDTMRKARLSKKPLKVFHCRRTRLDARVEATLRRTHPRGKKTGPEMVDSMLSRIANDALQSAEGHAEHVMDRESMDLQRFLLKELTACIRSQ